jgi:hypothetical protein
VTQIFTIFLQIEIEDAKVNEILKVIKDEKLYCVLKMEE